MWSITLHVYVTFYMKLVFCKLLTPNFIYRREMLRKLLVVMALAACHVDALLVCTDADNVPCIDVLHTEGTFGLPLPDDVEKGVKGRLYIVEDDMCIVPRINRDLKDTILMVARGGCAFQKKAEVAGEMGAAGLVIMDDPKMGEEWIIMGAETDPRLTGPTIPTVFIPAKHEATAVIEYIMKADDLGVKTYGMLFSGDDAEPLMISAQLMRLTHLIMFNMFFGTLLLMVLLVIRKVYRCCTRNRRRRCQRVSTPRSSPSAPPMTGGGMIVLGIGLDNDDVNSKADGTQDGIVLGVPLVAGVNDVSATLGVPLIASNLRSSTNYV